MGVQGSWRRVVVIWLLLPHCGCGCDSGFMRVFVPTRQLMPKLHRLAVLQGLWRTVVLTWMLMPLWMWMWRKS